MSTSLIVFTGSAVLFAALSLLVHIEERRGGRVLLPRVRGFFDRMLNTAYRRIGEAWDHFVEFVVKLGWYYSIHSFLRTALRLVVSIYDFLEHRFEENRVRAKMLHSKKRERTVSNQLTQVAEHKEQVALSAEQSERLKAEKLEERD